MATRTNADTARMQKKFEGTVERVADQLRDRNHNVVVKNGEISCLGCRKWVGFEQDETSIDATGDLASLPDCVAHEELENCPCCGKEPSVDGEYLGFLVTCTSCFDAELVDGQWRSDSLRAWGKTRADAVSAWNEAVLDAAEAAQ